jgi:hypothetical protein
MFNPWYYANGGIANVTIYAEPFIIALCEKNADRKLIIGLRYFLRSKQQT